MRSIVLLSLTTIFLAACNKSTTPVTPAPEPHPLMIYKNLLDSNIIFGKIASYDLNNDGEKDILFSTQLVGDPVEQKDKKQWMITSSFNTNLAVNNNEQIPLMKHLDAIPVTPFEGYAWYNASNILLSQKTITMTLPPYWEGKWKDANHSYIPVQVIKPGGVYNGWVEVSFSSANERLILHKAGMSTEVNKKVLAGK
jgi:hypothetical protein